MSKQRFEHAAAFFLLAGALKDAIEVCLNKLRDLDLAMVLARLYEDQVRNFDSTLKKCVLSMKL